MLSVIHALGAAAVAGTACGAEEVAAAAVELTTSAAEAASDAIIFVTERMSVTPVAGRELTPVSRHNRWGLTLNTHISTLTRINFSPVQ
jgi:hypothetical protein